MSHDLNLINADFLSYLSPHSSTKKDNQTRIQLFSFDTSAISNQNIYFNKATGQNFNQNYAKISERPIQQVDQALNQNHKALKNLIDMIDNRKTKSTASGLSFNKNKDFERTNRFSRKSNEEVKRERKNFVQDLKQVKQKMNEIMRLIDIKIKVNQEKTQQLNTNLDFDFIKQKLTIQSAKLDILQKDNSQRIQIEIAKVQDQQNIRHDEYITRNNIKNKQAIGNYSSIIEKAQNQQCLHLKHSFDKLNDDPVRFHINHNVRQQSEAIKSLIHNKLNSDNMVDFFTKEKIQENYVQFSSKKSSAYYSPQFRIISDKQPIEVDKKRKNQIKFAQKGLINLGQNFLQQTKNLERSKSMDNKLLSNNSNSQIKIVYKPPNVNLKDSNISNRFINHQSRFYNPNSFGRPTSNIILHPNIQTITIVPMPFGNRTPASKFSPPPTEFKPTPVPYRSQQKAIIRQWDEQGRPDLSFGLSSSVSTHRNGQNSTNLKKSSRNTQKFSFIQHFANNPDVRKRRQESIIKNQEAKQSIAQYGFPKIIPRQPVVVMQNPFQEWNKQFNMENSNLRQDVRINDNRVKTIVENSEHKNKDSIIHQTSFLENSKSGSKTSIPLVQLMQGGSAHKKRKKGLEVSKRMNQTEYIPKF